MARRSGFRMSRGGGSAARALARSYYREMKAQAAAAERSRQFALAESQVWEQVEQVEKLTTILKSREKDAFDWNALLNFDTTYAPKEFLAPDFDEPQARKAARQDVPIYRWLFGIFCSLIFLSVPAVGGILLLITGGGTYNVLQKRKAVVEHLRQKHGMRVDEEREKHARLEERRKARADMAPKLRGILQTEDVAPLLDILEEELSNEDLPVPLVFDIEFDDISGARIDLTLPETDEVPSQKYAVTARGKLSTKAMPQKERRHIYGSLACGLALRVAHEAFRVIPSLQTLEVRGLAEVNDPSTGHEKTLTALVLPTNRKDFQALNLDAIDPEAALEGLGGEFGCSPRLELKDVA